MTGIEALDAPRGACLDGNGACGMPPAKTDRLQVRFAAIDNRCPWRKPDNRINSRHAATVQSLGGIARWRGWRRPNASFEDEVERDENRECRDSGKKQVCGHEPPLGIP
ncbi:hypothetical protein [Mesorhizobium sp. NZP2298]|uniref:hypothetical protein n=1 Tax=Mesorhizobium sp. NZP2298 TaxID=2483403 RepID=UPI0015528160|nr:hypothetical protein [Mesorhizobium sp. NZP2298]